VDPLRVCNPIEADGEWRMTTRRDFLAVAAVAWSRAAEAALAPAHARAQATAPVVSAAAPGARFLTEEERATLRLLAGVLIPPDERSGGAPAARVDEYIDLVLGHAESSLQGRWRTGLAHYAGRSAREAETLLREAGQAEFNPVTDEQEFFVLLKGAVVEGFYTSEEGIEKELGYQGMSFVLEFPGCQHDNHPRPVDFQPALRERK
jgi:hypothetical protein